jgi:hypothetical protein
MPSLADRLVMRRVLILAFMMSAVATALVMQGCASSQKTVTKRLDRGERWISAATDAPTKEYCTSTREYVTALEYLRSHKDFSVQEEQAQAIAEKISKHCSGAADRFARVSGVLIKSNVGTKDAIQMGLDFAGKSEAQVQGFVTLFRYSFLRDYLDMDPYSSMQLARSVVADYTGNVDQARADFVQIVQFCIGSNGLDLPRPQCGAMAAQLAQLGSDFERGIATEFIEFYRFATASNGMSLATGDALRLARQTAEKGPTAMSNFRDAFRYGVSNGGLRLTQSDAIKFAQKMADGSAVPFKEGDAFRARGLASKSK